MIDALAFGVGLVFLGVIILFVVTWVLDDLNNWK